MPIINRFVTAPQQVVTYDFNDVQTNQAYIILYGHKDLADATTLIRQRISSNIADVRTQFAVSSGASALGEANFDYEFAIPQRVDGNLYVFVPMFAQATATQNIDVFLKIRILHYDGSTETLIGTQQTSASHTTSTDSATEGTTQTLTFAVDRQFKIGEKLRVEIEVWSNATTNGNVGFYHDPANTDYGVDWTGAVSGTALPSNMIVYVPIRPIT